MRHAVLCCAVLASVVQTFGGEPGTYSGRVVSPDGTPVPNASVVLPEYGDAPPRAETQTDADGRFTLSVAEPADRSLHRIGPALRIEVPDIGGTYVDERRLTLFPGANRDLGEIVLDPGKRYTGRVVNAEGQPVVGVTIECSPYRFILGHTVQAITHDSTVNSDADGTFVTQVIPIGAPTILASKEGYLTKYHDHRIVNATNANGRLPDLVLPPSKPILGRLVTADGRPVAGAEVNASGTKATSDAEGRFVLHGFKDEDKFQLQVDVDGYIFINWVVNRTEDGFEHYDVSAGAAVGRAAIDDQEIGSARKQLEEITVQSTSLDVVLEPAARISGTVVDAETGEPVKISRIVLCRVTRKKNGEVELSG